VRDKRNERKIPYQVSRYRWWTAEELRLFEQLSDEEIAERTGRNLAAVRQKRCKILPL
jgi:hypothetical protein